MSHLFPNTKDSMSLSLALAIRRLRGVRNQHEFADLLGVSKKTIGRWENGSPVSLSNLRLLVAHGLDRSYLAGDATARQAPQEKAA